jgi:hypothetical protein
MVGEIHPWRTMIQGDAMVREQLLVCGNDYVSLSAHWHLDRSFFGKLRSELVMATHNNLTKGRP